MTKKEESHEPEIPVAIATPVAVASTGPGQSVLIDLPIHNNSGLIFSDSPPRVTQVTDSALQQRYGDITGYYFSSLRLPGLAITDIYDSNRLRQLLLANQALPRKNILTRQAPPYSNYGCRYRHELPTHTPLGVTLDGFPPKVKEVHSGPLAGKMNPGQTIDAVCIPGQPDLTLQSGGFTAYKVTQVLEQTSHIPGRELIVKDQADVIRGEPRGSSNAAFDTGGCIVM